VNPGVDLDGARRVADAVLYEGYILYPYRASSQKNRSRWQFGVLMPPAYAAADPSETATAQSECVFEHSGAPEVEVHVRFLQVQRRTGPGPDTWDEAAHAGRVAAIRSTVCAHQIRFLDTADMDLDRGDQQDKAGAGNDIRCQ